MRRPNFRLMVLIGAVMSLLASHPLMAQENDKTNDKPEQITAVAQNPSVGARAAHVTIYVKQYSSDQEVAELAEALRTKGQDELEKQLEKINEKGNISVASSLGYGVPVIRQRPTEGCGRRTTG